MESSTLLSRAERSTVAAFFYLHIDDAFLSWTSVALPSERRETWSLTH